MPAGGAEPDNLPVQIDTLNKPSGVHPRTRLDMIADGLVRPPRRIRVRRLGQTTHERVDSLEAHLQRAVGGLAQMLEQRVVLRHLQSIARPTDDP